MEIRELRYFTQVARSGSFGRAASVLNVAQSAISRQLQKLEAELDVTLLVRRPHGVEVTEAGSILLEQAETLINYLAQIRDLGPRQGGNLRRPCGAGRTADLGDPYHPGGTRKLQDAMAVRDLAGPRRHQLVP